MHRLVKPQGLLGRMADYLLMPVMYVAQGNIREAPQRTHFWNNQKFERSELHHALDAAYSLCVLGDGAAAVLYRYCIPLFHIPVFGGWRRFVVLEAENSDHWHIGWAADHGFVGASCIQLRGPVRMTIGPGDTTFFAVTTDGTPCRVRQIGSGLIGEAGQWCRTPLL